MTVNIAPETAAPAGRRTRPRPRTGFILIALALAALMAVLDGTVVAVALNSLSGSLRAPLSTVVWVTIGYLLAAASMLPLLGWAGARFGGRSVFLTGLVLFVLGSTLCALAWSAESLIAFRIVQGFGGGLVEPMSLTLAAALADRNRVGQVLGTMSMLINIAPVLGPILGGLLLETGHWQWLFLVNLPFGAVVVAAALIFVPADRPDPTAKRPRADVRGLILLAVGFVLLLFALNRSGQPGAGWSVVTAAVVGAALLVGYGRHALRSTAPPALDLRLLRRPGFTISLLVMALVGLAMYSQLTSLPIFAADQHGLHGFDRGLIVCALGVGLLVSMTLGGRISDRTGPRPLVGAGSLVATAGFVVFAFGHDSLPLAAVLALFVVIGLGFGLCASPTFSGVYRILPADEQAQGTTALFMTVQFAASLGVTLLGFLQNRVPGDWLTYLFVILAGAGLAMAGLSRRLPGRP